MKKVILIFSILLITVLTYGQAYEGAVEYQKKQQLAAVIELPYPPSLVDAAMNDYLSKKGRSKGSDIKGFITYRNTEPLQKDSANADLYFKTERKSKKDKEVTVVSLLLAPVDLPANTDQLHYLTMNDAKDYLNGLATAIAAFDLEQSIKDQNSAVAKAESKYKNLVNEGDDLEKRRVELVKKIEDNKSEVLAQLREVENQKQRLTQWIGLRKF